MLCPTCAHDNPDGAKFCNNCGAALALTCPACSQVNPPGSRFCNNCGKKLAPDSPQVLNTPQVSENLRGVENPRGAGQISREFAAKLQSARDSRAMVGERRVVTMLFCDVAGSTAAAEQLDPERWAEIANQLFDLMIGPVYRYEGTVGRLMGDAILAFFGAPIAHEDDPQRAVMAGLEIIAAAQPFREQAARRWGLDINVRVGINTGLVMVGQVGSDLRMEYTAMGDAINVASRMEQTAEPGTVQISRDTYAYVAPYFETLDLGEIAVKGKSEPVRTYRPLRRRSRPDRLRSHDGLDAALVGRTNELNTLTMALKRVAAGAGGVVCLIGEAGLGKSRLVREAAARMGVEQGGGPAPLGWFETASLSYESARPYALFQRLLRGFWGIAPADDAQTIREKIAQGLPGAADEQEVMQVLLGADAGAGAGAGSVEGEVYKRRLYLAIENMALMVSAQQPFALVFDDLHWADPASVALVIHLMALAERIPMLLICLMRADRDAPGWQVKQEAERRYAHIYSEINLQALSVPETNALIDNLLKASNMTQSSRQRILAKTDGNPYFVEEVIRALIERGLIVPEENGDGICWCAVQEIDDADMPGNLQSLLVARIDRLEVAARRTLQLASVIGRSFYYRILSAIYDALRPLEADLDGELLTLQRKELIRQAAVQPEPEYVFRHALAQEAAYSTILLRQRQMFHRLTGNAIEELFADQLDDFLPILAYHFQRAEEPRAAKYAGLAGDAAFRLFAIPEALRHYTLALETLQAGGYDTAILGDADGEERLAHLFRRRGRCLELQSNYPAAQEVYAELERVARARESRPMLLAALLVQATNFAIPSPYRNESKSQALADEAMQLARELGDQPAEARVLWINGLIRMYGGRMPEAIPFGEQAAALARELSLTELLAQSLQDLSRGYMLMERLDKALQTLDEARPLLQSLNNLPILAENISVRAQVHVMQGEFDAAIAESEESLAIAVSLDNQWGRATARTFVGLAHLARGEIDRALATIRSLIKDAEQVGHPGRILGWFHLSWLYYQLGAGERAQEAGRAGMQAAEGFGAMFGLGVGALIWQAVRAGDLPAAQELAGKLVMQERKGTLLTNSLVSELAAIAIQEAQGDPAGAAHNVGLLIERLEAGNIRYYLPYARYQQAQIMQKLGRPEEARAGLQAARAAAEAIGNRILLWQILAELGEREAAEELVRFISEHISEEELRVGFGRWAAGNMPGDSGL